MYRGGIATTPKDIASVDVGDIFMNNSCTTVHFDSYGTDVVLLRDIKLSINKQSSFVYIVINKGDSISSLIEKLLSIEGAKNIHINANNCVAARNMTTFVINKKTYYDITLKVTFSKNHPNFFFSIVDMTETK